MGLGMGALPKSRSDGGCGRIAADNRGGDSRDPRSPVSAGLSRPRLLTIFGRCERSRLDGAVNVLAGDFLQIGNPAGVESG